LNIAAEGRVLHVAFDAQPVRQKLTHKRLRCRIAELCPGQSLFHRRQIVAALIGAVGLIDHAVIILFRRQVRQLRTHAVENANARRGSRAIGLRPPGFERLWGGRQWPCHDIVDNLGRSAMGKSHQNGDSKGSGQAQMTG